MKENTDKKISEANKVSKSQIIEKIKLEHQERFDQMLVDSEVIRNDIFYINFKTSYVNLLPKKVVFAMLPNVKNYFDSNCCGGSSSHGDVCKVDKEFINSIKNSDCNISEEEYSSVFKHKKFKVDDPYQYLNKGLLQSEKSNSNEITSTKKKKSTVFGDIKDKTSTISSSVSSTRDKLKSLGDKVNVSSKDDDEGIVNSESGEYSSLKSNYFNKLKFDYNEDKISENQPTYFIPDLTHLEKCSGCGGDKYVVCEKCDGRHEYTCPSCNGSGEITCGQCYGDGRKKCNSCNGSGYDREGKRCSKRCDKGWERCENCKGSGKAKCSFLNSKYNLAGAALRSSVGKKKEFCKGKGKITCNKCYSDAERYGKVDCKPCKATGEIGKIVFIEIEVGNISGEFYKYTNEIIKQINKNPEILFKYIDKSNVRPKSVYTDINGEITENYDSNSEEFCNRIEGFASLKKKNEYPRIVSEKVFYDVIPLSTLNYNHILSGTMHKVSSVSNANGFDILFHSEPTSVKKFEIRDILKSASWDFKKAFATRSYKKKLDKKHELYLLVRIARADGVIEDSEKRVLADLISDLDEFSNKEKAELFNLFSIKELPKLTEKETVFSSKERAETVIHNLNKMMNEDSEIETPEVKLLSQLKEKIHSNIGKHPGFLASFFRVWQVSIPIILAIFLIIGTIIYLTFFNSNNELSENQDKSNSTTSPVTEMPSNDSTSKETIKPINEIVNQTGSMSIIIQDAYCSEACHLVYIGADGKEYNTFIDANTPNDFLSENNNSINSIYQNFNAIIETEEIMNDGEKTLLITEIELIGPVEEENIIEELEPVSFNNQKKYDWGSKPKEVDGPALWVYTGITCDALSYTMNSSSRLKSQGKNNYTVDQLNDDDPTTAWVEGVEGYGIGEYLDVTEMQVMNNKIHILNGYQKDISSFKNNSRVKVFMVEVGGINMFKLHLKDVMGVQTFEIPEYYANEIIGAYSVRFIIEDVYKGDKWDDTAISEIFTCGG